MLLNPCLLAYLLAGEVMVPPEAAADKKPYEAGALAVPDSNGAAGGLNGSVRLQEKGASPTKGTTPRSSKGTPQRSSKGCSGEAGNANHAVNHVSNDAATGPQSPKPKVDEDKQLSRARTQRKTIAAEAHCRFIYREGREG